MLSARDRLRYSRQLLLPEVGWTGQEKLAGTRALAPPEADADATRVALDYLSRAGMGSMTVQETSTPGQTAPVPTAAEVMAMAGDGRLRDAAAVLAGAFAAVETVKALIGVGELRPFPHNFRLLYVRARGS